MLFTIAVNERRKNGDEWEDYPSFIQCVLYGKRGAAIAQYMGKGTKVCVDGKLSQSRWEKDGQKHSRVEIIVNEIDLMTQKNTASETPTMPEQPSIYDDAIPF